MRPLLDILTSYEGALQEFNDDETPETAEFLKNARAELMEVLQVARNWEAVPDTLKEYKEALQWCMPRLHFEGLLQEGLGKYPDEWEAAHALAFS